MEGGIRDDVKGWNEERKRERGMNVQRKAQETEIAMCLCGGA